MAVLTFWFSFWFFVRFWDRDFKKFYLLLSHQFMVLVFFVLVVFVFVFFNDPLILLRVNSGRYIIPFFFFSIEKGPSQILFASELSYRLRVKTKNSKGKRRLVFCSRAYKSWRFRDFPGGPVGKTPRSQCRGLCSIPGRGTRSHMHAATKSPHSAIKKNPTCRN